MKKIISQAISLPSYKIPSDLQKYFKPKLDNCFVCHLILIFRAVKRVLRKDGTIFLNLGDSYAGSGSPGGDFRDGKGGDEYLRPYNRKGSGLKPKDLCGIPWRVAFALQADGWWLRSAMPWVKRSAMPESVTDRPASALEHMCSCLRKARNITLIWRQFE